MDALSKRHSAREFARTELPLPLLSTLLWAANGINRADGRHTAPSAMNAQEIDIYVALPAGAYRYDATVNMLQPVAGSDVRRVTGYQDFVDEAPLDLVHVADHGRMTLIPVARRESFASVGGDHPECVSVRRRQRPVHRDPRLDQPRDDRGCARIKPRPAGTAVADRGISQELSCSVASAN
jgi:Nitroreductase family